MKDVPSAGGDIHAGRHLARVHFALPAMLAVQLNKRLTSRSDEISYREKSMPVPDFQSMMVPFLAFLSDGKQRELRQVREAIAQHFKLSTQDREELLPSGNQTRLDNRVGWCRTHLQRAMALEYVARGVLKITERGREVLSKNPGGITLRILDQYPEHYQWYHREKEEKSGLTQATVPTATPQEQIEFLIGDLKQRLSGELLEVVKRMDPFRFEKLVLDLLLAMGYGGSRQEAAIAGKGVNDGGIDGLINEDRLGLDRIYVQAKRWQNSVGRPEIQGFVGALAGKHAQKGIFLTTSEFSDGALEYVKNLPQRVILIGGQRLAELMIEHNIGVAPADTFQIKKVDLDYFEDV